MRVPESHLVERDAHRPGRVAAEVLVGKEEHSLGAGKRPVEHGPGVARRADDAAVATTEGLETRGRVDVGHGRDVSGVDHPAEVGPGVFHLLDRGHVGHRAAGGHVGEHDRHPPAAAGRDLLGPVGQDVGRLGHEVDAAEGDRLAVGPLGRRFRELVAVALIVGVGDHAVLLVVVAEDHQTRSHPASDALDPLREQGIVEAAVGGKRRGERHVRGGDRHDDDKV